MMATTIMSSTRVKARLVRILRNMFFLSPELGVKTRFGGSALPEHRNLPVGQCSPRASQNKRDLRGKINGKPSEEDQVPYVAPRCRVWFSLAKNCHWLLREVPERGTRAVLACAVVDRTQGR